MTTELEADALRKRLDAIILLLLESSGEGGDSTTNKIKRLVALGFTHAEVAQMIGKKSNYVSAVVRARKRSSTKSKEPKS